MEIIGVKEKKMFLVCVICYCIFQSSEKMKNEFQKRFEEMAADINKFKKAEQEIENYKDEAQKQRKIIYQLEKERDRYINEASDLTQKVRACSYISKIVV